MPKSDYFTINGVVIQVLPNSFFKIKLENDFEIIATISGKMRINHIRVLEGDLVKVEMSNYDLTKGRIVTRC